MVKNKYETMVIFDLSNGEEVVTGLIEKVRTLITSVGEIDTFDEWGKRRLAYPINDLREGYYVLITFTAPSDFPAELDRIYNITDGIMRSLIIRTDR